MPHAAKLINHLWLKDMTKTHSDATSTICVGGLYTRLLETTEVECPRDVEVRPLLHPLDTPMCKNLINYLDAKEAPISEHAVRQRGVQQRIA